MKISAPELNFLDFFFSEREKKKGTYKERFISSVLMSTLVCIHKCKIVSATRGKKKAALAGAPRNM